MASEFDFCVVTYPGAHNLSARDLLGADLFFAGKLKRCVIRWTSTSSSNIWRCSAIELPHRSDGIWLTYRDAIQAASRNTPSPSSALHSVPMCSVPPPVEPTDLPFCGLHPRGLDTGPPSFTVVLPIAPIGPCPVKRETTVAWTASQRMKCEKDILQKSASTFTVLQDLVRSRMTRLLL